MFSCSLYFIFVTREDSAKPSEQLLPLAESPAVRQVHRNLVNGLEKVSVSIATETEWSWLESLKLAGIDEGESSSLIWKTLMEKLYDSC